MRQLWKYTVLQICFYRRHYQIDEIFRVESNVANSYRLFLYSLQQVSSWLNSVEMPTKNASLEGAKYSRDRVLHTMGSYSFSSSSLSVEASDQTRIAQTSATCFDALQCDFSILGSKQDCGSEIDIEELYADV